MQRGMVKLTPTQLIYRAWLNTPKPIVYHTNDEHGVPINVECSFLDPLRHENFKVNWNGPCLICGAESAGGIPQKALLGSSYTDWPRHKCPESNYICSACAFTIMLNANSKRCCLCRYTFCAGETLEILNRAEMRNRLLNPPEPPFVMAVAVSQKKHIAFKSAVSYDRENYFCNLEEEIIGVNRRKLTEIVDLCEALRGIGLSKDDIAHGNLRYNIIQKYRLDAYDKINHKLRPVMTTRQFALGLYVAQKTEEEKAVCYLGLTPKTTQPLPQHYSSMQPTKAEMSNEARRGMTCGTKSSVSPGAQLPGQSTLENSLTSSKEK